MEEDDFFSDSGKEKKDIELIDDFNVLLNQTEGNYYVIIDSKNDFLIVVLNSIEIIKPESTTKTKTKKYFPSTAKFTFTNESDKKQFFLNKFFLGDVDTYTDQGGELLKDYRIIGLEDKTLKDDIDVLTTKVSSLVKNKATYNPSLEIKNEPMSYKSKYLKYANSKGISLDQVFYIKYLMYKSKYISLKKRLL